MLYHLTDTPDENDIPPVLTFLVQLANELKQSRPLLNFLESFAAKFGLSSPPTTLDEWSVRVATAHGVALERVKLAPPTPKLARLLVEVDRDLNKPHKFRLIARLAEEPIPEDERLYDEAELEGVFHNAYVQAVQTLGKGNLVKLQIEFFLPDDLLCLPVDQWQIRRGGKRFQPVGQVHPVVIRALDRILDPGYQPFEWQTRSEQLQLLTQRGLCNEHLSWITEQMVELPAELLVDATERVCLAFPFAAPDLLEEAIYAGFPVILWSREGCDHGEMQEKLRQQSDEKSYSLAQFPDLIKDKRQLARKTWGRHLTLLWDDFSQLPPHYSAKF